MRHLADERLLEPMEGRLDAADAAHLEVCGSCRAQLEDLQGVVARVISIRDPEPSPLFWEHFRARVSNAIAAAPAPVAPRLAAGFRWLAAASALVTVMLVGLTLGVQRPDPVGLQVATDMPVETQPRDDVDADEAWSLVRSVADDLDYDSVREAGVAPASGALDRAAMELSPSEQTALVKLLEEELKRTDS
jgi:hypothetical protein